jgi:hypothetical protein
MKRNFTQYKLKNKRNKIRKSNNTSSRPGNFIIVEICIIYGCIKGIATVGVIVNIIYMI